MHGVPRGVAMGLVLVTTLSGCEETDSTENPGSQPLVEVGPLTAQQLCAIYLSQNDNGTLCVQANVPSGANYSADDLAVRCRPGTDAITWATDLLDAVSAGRVDIAWQTARDCLSQSRALRASTPGIELVKSAAWTNLKEGPCTNFYRGAVIEGGACEDDWDCPEGMGCYSASPWEQNSARCLQPAARDAACSDYLPCGEGLRCAHGKCVELIGAGGDCDRNAWGADCLSGICDGEPPRCAPVQASRQIGDPCNPEAMECTDDCAVCRSRTEDAPPTCTFLGATGDYCASWNDCAEDLGCTNNICSTVAAGERCGPAVESLCDPGLICAPIVMCWDYDGDEGLCAAQTTCAYDPKNALCVPVEGKCSTLPTSGDCLFGYGCATGYYCNPGNTTCTPVAAEGEACSQDGTTAPLCGPGMACDTTCATMCELNEDCGEDAYCDVTNEAFPVCKPRSTDACTSTDACPRNAYCDTSKWNDDCDTHTDQASCVGDPLCAYEEYGTCVAVCWDHDHNAEACTEAGCTYDPDNGWCEPQAACNGMDTDEACSAALHCRWERAGYCILGVAPTGTCEPTLDVGEICDPNVPEMCTSADCAEDEQGTYRCAVELSGCNRDASFIRVAFLFGAVWALGWDRRKRR